MFSMLLEIYDLTFINLFEIKLYIYGPLKSCLPVEEKTLPK